MVTVTTGAVPQGTGRVVLRPAPGYEPPFDDESDHAGWLAALQQLARSATPPRPRPPAATAPAAAPHAPNPSAETRAAAARFMNTCLEVLNGYRPVAHLRTLASPSRAAVVTEAMSCATRRVAREAGPPPGGRTARVRLRRMRVCEPRPGVAEISAVLGVVPDDAETGAAGEGRCWAAALRIERVRGRWQCTVARLL